MKNIFKITMMIFFVSSLIVVASCKKSKDDPKPKTTQEKIAGKWTFIRSTDRGYDSNNNQTSIDEQTGASGEYYEFNSNGSLVIFVGGNLDSGKYSILNETTMSFSDNSGGNISTWIIKELTDNKILIENTETLSSGSKFITTIELLK